MRDIKFKGRVDKVWVYSDGFMKHKDGTIIIIVNKTDDNVTTSPIEKGTLCQFTGLKDKNGVDIYEGDIIEIDSYRNTGTYFGDSEGFHYTIKGMVTYQPSRGFCLKITKYWDTDNDVNVKGNTNYGYITQYKSKVVGNIHENKELLK